MPLTWLRNRRRRKLLGRPFPAEWQAILEQNVRHYRCLDETQQSKLCDLVHVFVAEKNWEGCGGLEMNDEVRVTIAGQACVLAVGVEPNYYFDRLQTILVYPGAYLRPPEWQHGFLVDPLGIPTYGEAWHGGPIVLSWKDVLRDARGFGHGGNLVLHEFAHHLDGLDGSFDGMPPMDRGNSSGDWRQVTQAEFERLVHSSRHGKATLLDDYGATNPAEFFAVATECFFERPRDMRSRHGELYDVLCMFYRQDPALWPEDRRSSAIRAAP